MACAPSKDSDQLGIRPVWSESSLCAQWVAKDPSFLHADSEDWVDAQADLHLRWAHGSFCWFCHEVAHIYVQIIYLHVNMIFHLWEMLRFQWVFPECPCFSSRMSVKMHCQKQIVFLCSTIASTVNVLKIRTENLNFETENTKHSVREVTNFAKGGN